MLHPLQITGVVLAGGKSSRFGSNKALSKYGDEDFLSHLINLLQPYSSKVVIAGHHSEYEGKKTVILRDIYPDIGPIGGIHTALTYSKTPWTLVLTCDMPLITKEIIMMMLASCRGESIIGWQHEKLFTTFPILISKSTLHNIENAINEKKYRIRQIYEWGNSIKLPIPKSLLPYFANINTPTDYKQLII